MVMRMTGLSSGMDIDGMIAKLMKAEQIPVDLVKAKKVKNEWLQDAYRAINTSIYPLKEKAMSLQYNANWPKPSGPVDGSGKATYSQAEKDEIYNKVTSLMSLYNDTSVAIKSKLDEKKERGFQPLTSEEKKALSDDDVANWEKKAKQGQLAGDNILQKAYTDLRADVTTPVAGAANKSLADIGITTGPYDRTDPSIAGKLYVDSDKLKAAIDADPAGVIAMFTQHGTGNERGIAQRLVEDASQAMSSISNKAGSNTTSYTTVSTILGKQDNDLDKRIAELTEKMNKKEDHFYTMFSAMEKAIANGNAQMSWLSSQFG